MNKQAIVKKLRENFKSHKFIDKLPGTTSMCDRCPISNQNLNHLWANNQHGNITCEYRPFLFLNPEEKFSNISEEMYNWSCNDRIDFFRKRCCSSLMETE